MNKLIFGAMWNGREAEIEASDLYSAKLKAIQLFKTPKKQEHMIIVMLLKKNGQDVVHSTCF